MPIKKQSIKERIYSFLTTSGIFLYVLAAFFILSLQFSPKKDTRELTSLGLLGIICVIFVIKGLTSFIIEVVNSKRLRQKQLLKYSQTITPKIKNQRAAKKTIARAVMFLQSLLIVSLIISYLFRSYFGLSKDTIELIAYIVGGSFVGIYLIMGFRFWLADCFESQ